MQLSDSHYSEGMLSLFNNTFVSELAYIMDIDDDNSSESLLKEWPVGKDV